MELFYWHNEGTMTSRSMATSMRDVLQFGGGKNEIWETHAKRGGW